MARARNIKHSFFTNDELAEITPLGRLLFIGLWTIADREGRLRDRPKKIKAEVLPYDDCDVDALLSELAMSKFIIRYSVDECQYIQIVNFAKHQNPHIKEAASSIPAPDEHGASPMQTREKHEASPADSGFLKPETTLSRKKPARPASSPDVVTVFDFWRQTMRHEKAVLDDKRCKLIKARLAAGYNVDDLCKAIRGCSKSAWHMGANDRGMRYDGLDLILRNSEKVEQFMRYDDDPPRAMSKQDVIEAQGRRVVEEFVNGGSNA